METTVREAAAPGFREHLIGTVIPLLAAAGVGVRYQVAGGVTVGLLISVALAPVWLPELARYRGARVIFGLGAVALVSGVVLTLADDSRATSTVLLTQETLRFAALLGIIGTLLWVRTQTGAVQAAGAFGAGMLVSVFVVGGNEANLWKYSLSLPVVVLVLAWGASKGRRSLQVLLLAGLSAASLAADARSLTSMLVLTAALLLQVRRPTGQARPRPWVTVATLAVVAFAAFQVMQALILEGALGEAARQRSEAQLAASGSILVGGRPEAGAAVALIAANPWGFGSGTLLTSNDLWLAKIGMNALNYNPNNGYVESYMFGDRIEVHSVLGDMWLRFGPVGAAFAVVAVAWCIYGLASRMSDGTADSMVIYIVLLAGWNLLFGPLETSYRPLGLAIAVALLPVGQRAADPLREYWHSSRPRLRHAPLSTP